MGRHAATRILNSLAEPFRLRGHAITLSASIGIAFFPQDGADPDSLLTNAGIAMSWAKKTGGGFRFFDANSNQNAAMQLTLESDMANAIEMDEFVLEYQPQCDAATGEMVAAEALIRWNHPEQGRLMPDSFIPVAEASGLVNALGDWVLRRACQQACKWDANGLPPFRVSVNISSLQFNYGNLVDNVKAVLEEFELDPSRLELEITETALLEDADHVLDTVEALRILGVSLALDDFGTGYSSLSHLFWYKIDTLKIDRSFVSRIGEGDNASEIIAAVIAMSKRLEITVIAEGVETPEHERFLCEEGCNLLQGYGISRPATPEQLEAWIRARS
jgi:predicted signal transduction protein with EAL and GGDEF domain